MILIRSAIFNILFFFIISFSLIFGVPLLLLNKRYTFIFWKNLSAFLDFITQKIAGIKYTIENPHNILNSPAIYAVRHESTWETLILIHKFHNPIFVVKKELLNIPVFGSFSKKVGTIGIDRELGVKSLIDAVKQVYAAVINNHPVVIFPEGTRLSTGTYSGIKRGIALFYQKANCPVIPVIHNSGKFWPRRGFLKNPGNITLKFLDPIQPGLSQDEFLDKLNSDFRSEIERLSALN